MEKKTKLLCFYFFFSSCCFVSFVVASRFFVPSLQAFYYLLPWSCANAIRPRMSRIIYGSSAYTVYFSVSFFVGLSVLSCICCYKLIFQIAPVLRIEFAIELIFRSSQKKRNKNVFTRIQFQRMSLYTLHWKSHTMYLKPKRIWT